MIVLSDTMQKAVDRQLVKLALTDLLETNRVWCHVGCVQQAQRASMLEIMCAFHAVQAPSLARMGWPLASCARQGLFPIHLERLLAKSAHQARGPHGVL